MLEQRSTGSRWVVRSKHVVACDGAKSQVRKDLGIESEGEDGCELCGNSLPWSRVLC